MIVRIRHDDDAVIAVIEGEGKASIAGYGDTLPEALRDLAGAIQYAGWPLPDTQPASRQPVRVK